MLTNMNCYNPYGYQICCDRCGKVFEYGGRTVFKSTQAAVATARELGWIVPKDKPFGDLCPECRQYKIREKKQ